MNKIRHTVDTLFVLVLFAVFVVMALYVTSSGALAYKNAAAQMDERFDRQTCVSYITAKIRANNEEGKIGIGEFGGVPALCIYENAGESEYVTYIYQYDGAVRELFCSAQITLEPSAGAALTDAGALDFSKDGNLYRIKLTDTDGKITEFYVNAL